MSTQKHTMPTSNETTITAKTGDKNMNNIFVISSPTSNNEDEEEFDGLFRVFVLQISFPSSEWDADVDFHMDMPGTSTNTMTESKHERLTDPEVHVAYCL
jgi:hypothetical protein